MFCVNVPHEQLRILHSKRQRLTAKFDLRFGGRRVLAMDGGGFGGFGGGGGGGGGGGRGRARDQGCSILSVKQFVNFD